MPISARGLSPRPTMWTVTRLPLLLLHHHVLESHIPHSAHHHKGLLESLPLSEPLLMHPPRRSTVFSMSAPPHEAPREPTASSCLPCSLVGPPGLANTNCSRLRVAGPPCLLRFLPCFALSHILPFFLLMTQSSSLSWAGALPPWDLASTCTGLSVAPWGPAPLSAQPVCADEAQAVDFFVSFQDALSKRLWSPQAKSHPAAGHKAAQETLAAAGLRTTGLGVVFIE